MAVTVQRTIKWCPELGLFAIRTSRNIERFYTERDIDDFIMSDDTRKAMEQLMFFAREHLNQPVEY